MILLGSWANTFKSLRGKWRYELYCLDLAFGAMLIALILAFTFGSFGFDGFLFLDDVKLAGKRQDAFGFLSGCLFNMGTMLVMGGISVTGMSVAIPIGMSTGLIVTSIIDLIVSRQSNLLLVLCGSLALAASSVMFSSAWYHFAKARLLAQVRLGKTKSTRLDISMGGVLLSAGGGLFLGFSRPVLDLARVPDIGLGPYSLGVVFAVGIVFSTFVMNLFLMNLPVSGEPIDIVNYFQAQVVSHLPGIFGGMLLGGGLIASFVVARADGAGAVLQRISQPVLQSAMVLAMLWGLVAWKELSSPESKVKGYVAAAALLLIAGIGLTTFALPVTAH